MNSISLKEHIYSLPLEGINMVEANAGTGKTFNIVLLYIRSVIEKKLDPEQILTVTFTRDATKDLNQRIFEGLAKFKVDLLNHFESGIWSENALTTKMIVDNAAEKGISHNQILERIEHAISNYYKAAIYTIHGLANQILSSHAIETNTPLTFEMTQNESELIHKAIEIELLKLIETLEKNEVGGTAIALILDRTKIEDIKKSVKLIGADLDPKYDVVSPPYMSIDSFLSRVKVRGEQFLKLPNKIDVLEELSIILDPQKKHKHIYNKLDKFYKDAVQFIVDEEKSNNFCIEYLATKNVHLDADEVSVKHPNLAAIEDFIEDVNIIYSISPYLVIEAKKRLQVLKDEANILGYNDLVFNLCKALSDEQNSKTIINRVHDRYKMVFVDEFQDTDPYQIQIFSELFTNTTKVPMFTFGDPKQSIYSFRGADLTSYVSARAKWKPTNYHLTENYRSSEALLKAVNAIFYDEKSFLYDDILFKHSSYPEGQEPISVQGVEPSEVIELIDVESSKVDEYLLTVCKDISTQINSLLSAQSTSKNGEDKLGYKDFVILCQTNSQCVKVKKILSDQGFDSLIIGGDEVFNSTTAEDLYQLLHSIVNYTDRRSINAFTINPLVFEWDIKDQNFIDSKYEEFRPLLQKAHNLWSNFGIESCFDYLNDNLNISQRVAEWNNAERVLTDLNHLIEYLTEEEKRLNLKLNSLLNHIYFSIADSRSNGGTNESLTGQRLESDENLIKIMTVHKSKGLQFPVVFCPFIYPNSALKLSGENKPQKPYVVKSKGDSLLHISKNLEGDLAKNLEKAKELQLKQEKVRTLYVAFTRAKFKLYIYKLSDLNFTDTSRKSYNTTAWASIEGLNKSHWIKENGFISRRISYYNTDGSHNLNSAHRLNHIALVPPKKLSRPIIPSWLKQSFSGLTSKSSDIFTDESVLNLYDFYEGDDEPNKSKDVIFKGAYFGTIVHDILEKIPFYTFNIIITENYSSYKSMIHEIVKVNYKPKSIEDEKKLIGNIEDLIKSSIQTPFYNHTSLQDIEENNLTKEQEFVFDVKTDLFVQFLEDISDNYPEVNDVIVALQVNKAPRLRLNGFIDLLAKIDEKWFIIDYKTNYLSNGYGNDEVLESMIEHKYRLQYIIYSCAWVKFQKVLGKTKDDCMRNFGGSIYLYLRGLDKNSIGQGVYQDKMINNGTLTKIIRYFWE